MPEAAGWRTIKRQLHDVSIIAVILFMTALLGKLLNGQTTADHGSEYAQEPLPGELATSQVGAQALSSPHSVNDTVGPLTPEHERVDRILDLQASAPWKASQE